MISPSFHWTCPWFFPTGFPPLVCHQQVTIPTNTSTKLLQLWDGDHLVTKNHLICHEFFIYISHVILFITYLLILNHFLNFSQRSCKHRLQAGKCFNWVRCRLQGGGRLWQICYRRQYLCCSRCHRGHMPSK